MPRIQHILYNEQTPVEIDVPTRPSSTYTVSMYSGDGAAIFEGQSATLSTINTTLSSAATKGDTTVAVASATGISSGLEFWIRTPDEKVAVRSISGTTVTLVRPLIRDHASGVTAEGTRLTYTVTAAQAGTLFWDGRLEWLVDTTAATAKKYIQACHCTKYPFDKMVTEQDVFDEEAKFEALLDDEAETSRLLTKGVEEVIKRISAATSGRVFATVGPIQAVDAMVFAVLMRLYRSQPGEEADRLYQRYRSALQEEINVLTSGLTYRDEDQDGVVEEHEQASSRSGRLIR